LTGKELIIVLFSSRIREGATERLRVSDYGIKGQIIAGKLLVYAGDVEQYSISIF